MITELKNKIDTEEYKRVYGVISGEAKTTVKDFLDNSDLTGEETAGVITGVINNVIDKSLVALQSGYDIELMQKMY